MIIKKLILILGIILGIQEFILEVFSSEINLSAQEEATECIEKGKCCFMRKFYANAIEHLSLAPTQNINDEDMAKAKYWLGRCYAKIEQVERAISLFSGASEKENIKPEDKADAQFWLGKCYDLKGQEDEAFKYYMLAAEQNHLRALYMVSSCYLDGTGVEENKDEGLYCLNLAAQKGYIKAYYAMAKLYKEGECVVKDLQLEWHYRVLAADGGYGKAQYEVADTYHRGNDHFNIPVNLDKAFHYYFLAATNRYKDSQDYVCEFIKHDLISFPF